MTAHGASEEEERTPVDVVDEEREHLETIVGVLRDLATLDDPDRALGVVVDALLRRVGAARGFAVLVAEEDLAYHALRNLDGETIRRFVGEDPREPIRKVLAGGGPLVIEDAIEDGPFDETPSVRDLVLRSLLIVPLRVGDRVTGALVADDTSRIGAFGVAEARFASLLADAVAGLIDRIRGHADRQDGRSSGADVQASVDAAASGLHVAPHTTGDVDYTPLLVALEKLEAAGLQAEKKAERLRQKLRYDYTEIITRNLDMLKIFQVLDKVIDSTVPVLINGESGTGKELIARAIHYNGPRSRRGFVSENCAAIPPTLIESEFFGYVRGAFTGANKDKKGLFEVADKGTLFLDEIGDLNLDLQTKFLRVLQEGEIRRVGGKHVIRVDVRLVAATNRDLADMIRHRRFREDLYYRINVINVKLPSLRYRREDIPILVDYFLGKTAKASGTPRREISREAFALLCAYDWPGNIRELENEVERAVALSRGVIGPEQLSENLRSKVGVLATPQTGRTLRELIALVVEKAEREALVAVLAETGGDQGRSAELLGIPRPTFSAKMERYGLRAGRPSGGPG